MHQLGAGMGSGFGEVELKHPSLGKDCEVIQLPGYQ